MIEPPSAILAYFLSYYVFGSWSVFPSKRYPSQQESALSYSPFILIFDLKKAEAKVLYAMQDLSLHFD